MREIVLDTETTGVDATGGDRIVEIGCVEILNQMPTGRHFHVYLNPERPMSEGAFKVHGLSDAFLSDKPRFAEVVDGFEQFVDGARLVIHNASFDMAFLNMELGRLGRPALPAAQALDTLMLARRKHPGAANSLDALCVRYGIDNSKRTKHGALLDAEILAEVYLELSGGRQAGLSLTVGTAAMRAGRSGPALQRTEPLAPRITAAELAAHDAFVGAMGETAIWRRYLEETQPA